MNDDLLNLAGKLKQIADSFSKTGELSFDTDLFNGQVKVNGTPFSLLEQIQLSELIGEDGGLFELLEQVMGLDEQFNTLIKEPQPNLDDFLKIKASKIENDKKEDEIKALKKRIAELEKRLIEKANTDVKESNESLLKFPDHFYNAFEYNGFEKELSPDEIQDLIDSLKSVEVPKYSFTSVQAGDTIIIKIHDDEGISYIVSNNYYIATV